VAGRLRQNAVFFSRLLRRRSQIGAFEDRSPPGWKLAFIDAVQNANWNANFFASLNRSVIEVEKHKKLTLLPVFGSGYQALGVRLDSCIDQDYFRKSKIALRHPIVERLG
jgi:hypothetical protein